jgi:hypothetical protein
MHHEAGCEHTEEGDYACECPLTNCEDIDFVLQLVQAERQKTNKEIAVLKKD